MSDLNASLSRNGRIIPKNSGYDSIENRGIRTHNKFGKFFTELFGSGTVTVNIDSKTYYLNRGSSYKLLKLDKTVGSVTKKADLVMQLILYFDSVAQIEPNKESNNSNDSTGETNNASLSQTGQIEKPNNFNLRESETSDHTITSFVAPVSDKEQIEKLNNMMTWANENCAKLGSDAYPDLMTVIKFFKFTNTDLGMKKIEDQFSPHGCYWFREPDLEIDIGIPFHEDKTWEKTKQNLMRLSEEFIGAFCQLYSEKHKIEFSKNLHGNCIEGRTNAALIYASNIIQNPHIESFFTLMGRYRIEAHEALKNEKLSLDLLTDHIMKLHGGDACIPDKENCTEGLLDYYHVRRYLEFAEVDMD